MRYIPLTEADQAAMLKSIGADSVESLFSTVPASIRRKAAPDLPSAKTESELIGLFRTWAEKNLVASANGWRSYLGGGFYEHFIPTVVDTLSMRSEFVTAYTPYQPEVSQGTLQAIFEFQSMVANLLGLDVANASMYDGASAVAEGVLMALRLNDGERVLVSKGVHPETRQVIRAYLSDSNVEIVEMDLSADGRTQLPSSMTGTVAVVVQQPNFYGVIENLEALTKKTHEAKALFVAASSEALAFGLLRSPGELGADIAAAEGQSLGNPLNYGGPHVGLFAAKKEHMRQLPGRLVGKTTDLNGREGYVLTLSTREQHIRRERATSNICTNHSYCALRSAIYMAALGAKGLREVASRNTYLAQKLRQKLLEMPGVQPVYTGPIFNEFAIRLPISTEAYLANMEHEKILGGIPLSRFESGREHDLLLAVTENKSEEDLDHYVSAARKAL